MCSMVRFGTTTTTTTKNNSADCVNIYIYSFKKYMVLSEVTKKACLTFHGDIFLRYFESL